MAKSELGSNATNCICVPFRNLSYLKSQRDAKIVWQDNGMIGWLYFGKLDLGIIYKGKDYKYIQTFEMVFVCLIYYFINPTYGYFWCLYRCKDIKQCFYV